MSAWTRLLGIAVLATVAIPVAAAGPLKLATQAPTDTMWDKELKALGATWSKATAGRVSLTVFADGSQGDESTTVRKMRPGVDALQAALLTAGGLSHIDPAFNAFTIPFFFETDAEELAAQKALEPMLESSLQKKGFHLLCWGTGGWLQIFSKKPINTLSDLKAAKLYTSKDDDEMVQWYTKNGFHPVPLILADIGSQLKLPTGLIDTTPNTPYLAAITQIFTSAKYMLDIHVAPLVGAVIVSTSAWNQISAEDQAKITESARAMEARIRAAAPSQDTDSIDAMKKRGLQVIQPDAKNAADFRAAAGSLGATMRGGMVPEAAYDTAKTARDAVRKK